MRLLQIVNWKTTIMGIGSLMALWGPALELLFDSDPLTQPDWNLLVAGTISAIGLIYARDKDKSTEDQKKFKTQV